MTIAQALQKAITEDNAVLAGRCVDQLRTRMTYNQIFELARTQVPELTLERWDGLLYEADTQED